HGKGAHRTRTTRRVVLYHTALHGRADTHGRFSPLLHVAYQPHRPVMATLTVRARTTCSTATKRTSLTILPFSRRVPIAYQPRKPMRASMAVTVRLSQGTAAGRATATLLPRRHH